MEMKRFRMRLIASDLREGSSDKLILREQIYSFTEDQQKAYNKRAIKSDWFDKDSLEAQFSFRGNEEEEAILAKQCDSLSEEQLLENYPDMITLVALDAEILDKENSKCFALQDFGPDLDLPKDQIETPVDNTEGGIYWEIEKIED